MSVPSHEFRRLLAAEGVANFGAMLSRLAIPWLAALGLGATPLQMAALLVADVAAGALGALLLGAWVERQGRRAVMLRADLLRAALLAALALLAWQGAVTMTALVLAAAAHGLLTMAFELARSAWMAQRLAAGELVHRNAQMSMATSLSETGAFALGGWLFQGLGAAASLLANAVSYLGSARCLRGVAEVWPPAVQASRPVTAQASPQLPLSPSMPPPPAWGRAHAAVHALRATASEVRTGLAALAASPPLRALAGLEAGLAFAGALVGTSYMIYVVRDLGLATGPLGVVFALGGLGAVVGARAAAALGARCGSGRAMALGLAAAALGSACIPLAGSAATVAGGTGAQLLLALHQIVGDAGQTLYEVHDRTLRQTAVDVTLLARADAALRGVGQAATLGAGVVAARLHAPTAAPVAGRTPD